MMDIEETKKNFGKKFKQKRQELGYSQERMTEALDLESPNYISNIENGKTYMSFGCFYRACKVFNIHPFEFFFCNETTSEEKQIRDEMKTLIDTLPINEVIFLKKSLTIHYEAK